MPLGLSNAPGIFQKLTNNAFQEALVFARESSLNPVADCFASKMKTLVDKVKIVVHDA